MSDSLKTNYLFMGPHLPVNEVCHQQNLVLKSDQSRKGYEMSFKITAFK